MSEAAILAAVDGVNNRLDDLNDNVSQYRKEGQQANAALWGEVNEGKNCRTKMKLDHQELKGDVKEIKGMVNRLTDDMKTVVGSLSKHIRSKTEHFNQEIKDEGMWSYAWRKKLQIAITSTIVTIITVGGGVFVAWLQSLPGV